MEEDEYPGIERLPYQPPVIERGGSYGDIPPRGYERDMAPMRPAPIPEPDDVDALAAKEWARDVMDRGNVVRYVGNEVLEVNPDTRAVISRMPTFYRKV